MDNERSGVATVITQGQVMKGLRQALVTDLGVTADLVRGLVTSVVEREVAKRIAELMTQGGIERLATLKVNEYLTEKKIGYNPYPVDTLKKIVADAVDAEVKRVVAERVRIDVSPLNGGAKP